MKINLYNHHTVFVNREQIELIQRLINNLVWRKEGFFWEVAHCGIIEKLNTHQSHCWLQVASANYAKKINNNACMLSIFVMYKISNLHRKKIHHFLKTKHNVHVKEPFSCPAESKNNRELGNTCTKNQFLIEVYACWWNKERSGCIERNKLIN